MLSVSLGHQPRRSCWIPTSVMAAIDNALSPAKRSRIEGIAYLLGRTDGTHTCLLSCMAVNARCTRGSFFVPAHEMVRVVRRADELGLQVAGQIHTHPFEAFHSDGDEDGAQIRFDGYVSIVLPDYGDHLPQLTRAAAFMFSAEENRFLEIPIGPAQVIGAIQ